MTEREYQNRILEYMPSLYRIARTVLMNDHDCADAVQEAVFQGWLKRGQLRDMERFRPWIIRIVINECRNLQRRHQKQLRVVGAIIDDFRAQPQPKPETALEAAVSELPEKYRIPIVLHYSENYSTREIAQIMNIPEGRLRERMRTARKMLGRALENDSE